MKIIKLQAENVKRLKAVEITPDAKGNLVVIAGRNAQGKTSVLDSIMMALASARKCPAKPIREGTERANVKLDLGDLVVERTITASGNYLKVTNRDGFDVKSPQAMLDKLVGSLSFDPLEFTKMEPVKQVKILKELTGLDFTVEDKKYKDYFDQRTIMNREMKSIQDRIDRTPIEPGVPENELKISDLADEFKKAQETITRNQEERVSLEILRNELQVVERRRMEIIALMAKLQEESTSLDVRIAEIKNKGKAQAIRVKVLQEPDLDAITTRIAEIEQVNEKIRALKARRGLDIEKTEIQAKIVECERAMDEVSAGKEKELQEAKMPIRGLEFGEQGINFNGIPFSGLSGSEQLKISLAMGIALNPQVRVILIRDGSLLDQENMKVIQSMAEKHDMQIWIERVDESGAVGVVIEDGAVKGVANAS
jgi:hypothetical protein